MARLASRLLILLAGSVGLAVATASPAIAGVMNHTEPITAVGRGNAPMSVAAARGTGVRDQDD
jgi:hypothetical protein